MRVAFVVPETTHHRDRMAAERLERVARLLVGRGHDVAVFCARWWGEAVDAFEYEDVEFRAVAAEPGAGRALKLRLSIALRRFGPDVVHVDGSFPGAVGAARYGAKLARAPLVGEWYDVDPGDVEGVGAVDRLVAPSRLVQTRLREAGADGDDVAVIPDPVDLAAVRAVDPDPEYEEEIVYARRLDEGANLESLLLALAELRGFDWSATVIGDGPQRAAYEQQAEEMRIDDRVCFVGELARDQRIGVYRAARAFVQTAHHCPYPTELAWALVCGCIGIVEYHADSSAHELVEGRERGVRTTSETELVDAIREAGDRERRDYDAGFEAFGEAPVLERYLAVYRELLGDDGLL